MSGGHWDYIQHRIEEIGNEINPREKSKEEKEFGKLLIEIANLLGDLDWYYSGDTGIEPFIKRWNEFKKKEVGKNE